MLDILCIYLVVLYGVYHDVRSPRSKLLEWSETNTHKNTKTLSEIYKVQESLVCEVT